VVDAFIDAIKALESANLDENHPDDDIMDEAKYMQGTVLPAMDAVRATADALEKIVADDLWPLPKYSEILFIK
jgi:glutamine synthetase